MPRKAYQVKDNDCFSACVASILEVPVEEVPNPNDNEMRDLLLQAYLKEKGYGLWTAYRKDMGVSFTPTLNGLRDNSAYFIGSIYKGDGSYHAVVFHNGEIWHDPDRNSKVPYTYEIDCISVFVKLFNEGE